MRSSAAADALPWFHVNAGTLHTPAPAWRAHLHSEIASLAPNLASSLLVATSTSRNVVDLLAGVNVGQDYRDRMNAGPTVPRLATFESASPSAERVRPPMRGDCREKGFCPAGLIVLC